MESTYPTDIFEELLAQLMAWRTPIIDLYKECSTFARKLTCVYNIKMYSLSVPILLCVNLV